MSEVRTPAVRHDTTVLVIEGAPPNPTASAGERASLDLMLALRERGNAVVFHGIGRAGPGDDALYDLLDEAGIAVTASRGGGIEGIAAALDATRPAVVIVQRPGPALAAITALQAHPEIQRIYWGHDIHAWRLAAQNRVRDEPADHQERLTVLAERRAWAAYDVCVYPAAREAAYINAEVPNARAMAIPYFRLDAQDLAEPAPHHGRRGALMVGGAFHAPNRDAVEFAVAEIVPLLADVPFTVVGAWPADLIQALKRPGVEFTGAVSDQRLLQLQQQHLCLLAPLRFGAGTRRKLVAAMGLGLPVVTTAEGVRGLLVDDATAADGVLIADTAESLAHHVNRLAADAQFWTWHSQVGAERVTQTYRTSAYDAGIEQVLQVGAARRDERLRRS